ncbi:MAG: alkaline phosphatase family protein, partial [Myxococcota bacterium]
MASQGNPKRTPTLTRRGTLHGATAAAGIAALGGCTGDGTGDDDGADTGGQTTGGSTTTGGESSSGPGTSDGGVADSTGGSDGSTGDPSEPLQTCAEPGEMSAEALLANVDTIVVLMMENRSFDHYFGAMSLEEELPVDGLVGDEANPDAMGNPIAVFPSDYWVVEEDPPHGWNSSRVQFNDGANDGFVTAHLASGATDPNPVMGYHTRDQLPVLYALADNYVLCERWFASVMGPTWPNRFYAHLGTAGGQMENTGVSDIPSIWDSLDDAGITNTYY